MAYKMEKPTIPELNKCLKELVKWQQFALYLPGIDYTAIKMIKENEHHDDVVEQKIAVYDKWLQVYPNASWDDVINALETAEENTIAEQLREKYPAITPSIVAQPVEEQKKRICSTSLSTAEDCSTPGPDDSQEVTVPEAVVNELDSLHQSFCGLTHDVKSDVQTTEEKNGNINDIVFHVQQARAFRINSLQSVKSTDELFTAIHPHYHFLNYHLIVHIALFLAGIIADKATEYKENVVTFMKTTKIRFLLNALKQYHRINYCNIQGASITMVEIRVENGWGDQNLWLVEMLVKTLFPLKHPQELLWYDIVPGSVVMTFIAFEHMTPSLIESSRKKTEFMRLIGVISLKIGDELVWKQTDEGNANPFSFEHSLIQASLANNIEAVHFLLQYTQVNVNTKNTTNTLINAGDEGINYVRRHKKAISILETHHATFSAILKDVEYEFRYIQGRMTPIDNILNSSPPIAADDDSKSTHHPLDNFLNGRILAGLSDQLPEHLSTRVKQYQERMDGITKQKSLLIHLSSLLVKYFPAPFPDSIEVILFLHSVWRDCSVWYVEQLGQLTFTPTLFHKLQWFRVDTSEEPLRVVLLADKKLMDSLTKECFGIDESLTSLLGVVSVRVDDTVVISNDYSNGYTFSEAMELAKAIGNDEISDLLLQIKQSPVNLVRFGKPDSNNNHRFLPEPDSTPLMIACCNNYIQLVRFLLDHKADPNIQTRNGYTALIHSTVNSKIFQMLLDHGADIKACTFLNDSVLNFACWTGNVKIVKTIIAKNCDLLHIVSSNGWTALKTAIQNGHTTVVELLLQAKADPNIQYDNEELTALQLANKHGHTAIVELLLQGGAA